MQNGTERSGINFRGPQGDNRMAKYYHMIIQRPADWIGETRREYISTRQGAAPQGWICVGVCGYHEK